MDFIKYKIVARSVCASIVPIMLYSLAFGIYKITDGSGKWQYTNLHCWLGILALTLVYPLNQLPLFLLFSRLDNHFEKKLVAEIKAKGNDKKLDPLLRGNFAPCGREMSYEVANIVQGKIPTDITGIYMRNGPDPVYLPENKCHHWFDGDAMIHGMRIKNGQLYYCNRWMKCDKFKAHKEAGKVVQTTLGEMSYKSGILKMLLHRFEEQIGYRKKWFNKFEHGTPNTSVIHH